VRKACKENENQNQNENENNAVPDWTLLITSMMTIRTDRRTDCVWKRERNCLVCRPADKAIKISGRRPLKTDRGRERERES